MSGTRAAVLALAAVAVLGACRSRRDRSSGTETCTPGARIVVTCSERCGLGYCRHDPVLQVCDGTMSVEQCGALAATDPLVLGGDDDSPCGGLCPFVQLACPASGSVTVVHHAFDCRFGEPCPRDHECEWDVAIDTSPPAP
jgi:hypothetical protein